MFQRVFGFISPQDDECQEYAIYFKKDALKAIMTVKGCRTKADLARKLGFHPSIITNIEKRRDVVSSAMICRIAEATGNIKENWWTFYEIRPDERKPRSHQKYNMAKYRGEMAYNKGSVSAEDRKKDGPVIERK